MKKICFLLFCCWSFSCWALTARLSQTVIPMGQSVELELSSPTPIASVDFSPLTKDFMLGGQSTTQSSQYINGVGSTTYQKSIVLFPVKEGVLEIPPLSAGPEKTQPLTLTVQSEKKGASQENINLPKLAATTSNKTPYIGQSFFYTLTLSEKDNLAEAELIPNFPEGIKIANIGQDSEKRRDNQIVFERPYLIKAEKTGPLKILPALLNGTLLYKTNRKFQGQGLFSLLNATDFLSALSTGKRPFQVISNPVSIEVQEKPQNWEGWWLPTPKASLTMIPEIPENLKTGETFKLTLNLKAIDVDSNDLPIPKLSQSALFRYYPQPEERHISGLKDGHFQGSVQVVYEVMPLKEGILTLPDIKIPWFNTQTKQKEIAQIAPFSVQVKVGPIDTFLPTEISPTQNTPSQNEGLLPAPKKFPFIYYAMGGGLLALILISFLIWWGMKKKKKTEKKEKPIPDFYPF